MTSRRTFIQAGLAAAVSIPFAKAFGSLPPAAMPLHAVYFDQRFAAARAFGEAAVRLGGNARAMSGAVHDFWYHDLAPRWRTRPIAIAGMTDPQAVFLLEMMAADVGMRVVYRGHHLPQSSGRYAHEGFGPPHARRAVAEFDVATRNWATGAARIVAHWPLAECSIAASTGTNVGAASGRALGHQALVSWVIAPVTRVG